LGKGKENPGVAGRTPYIFGPLEPPDDFSGALTTSLLILDI